MKNSSLKSEHIATLAYLTPLGLIAAYFLNREEKNKFVTFHIKNMFGLCLIYYLGPLLGYAGINILHDILFYIGIFCWVYSFINMLRKRSAGVPFLDTYFQEWFKFLD